MDRHTDHAAMLPRLRAASGFTLIELMISITIGLLIMATTSALFVGSSNARRQIELSADVIESGRYGLETLSRQLSQAGFYGTLAVPTGTTLDPCAVDPAAWAGSLAIPAMGFNNAQTDPACLNRKPGTDAIFIQRASTCTIAESGTGCGESSANVYLQVSECGSEYSAKPFVVARGRDPSFTLQTKACDGTPATKRRLIRRIYFITPSDVLSYVTISPSGVGTPVALVENIEQMQIEYAVDSNDDGTPDSFTPTPADWSQVIGVRIWLLARSSETSTNAGNALTLQMSDTTLTIPVAAANFKRRVYSTYIPFMTPKSRRES